MRRDKALGIVKDTISSLQGHLDRDSITEDKTYDELGLDEVDRAEIALYIEDEHRYEIPEEVMDKSLKDLVDYLEAKYE